MNVYSATRINRFASGFTAAWQPTPYNLMKRHGRALQAYHGSGCRAVFWRVNRIREGNA